MMKRRLTWLALLLATLVLAFVAAGCGGDDDEEGAGTTAATEGTTTEASTDVSGSITVLAVWTGEEGKSFQAVLDAFKEKYPNVKVAYKSAAEPATVLSTAVEGGNPPDIAALPQPGFMTDFAERGALKPIDFMKDKISEGYSQSWLDLGTVQGKLYGLFWKGVNKSTVWYNVHAYEDAGVEPAENWADFLDNSDTIKASGLPPYSIGGANGWTLTDLFENIYAHSAGADKYRQLSEHKIPYTDQTVVDALTEMGKVLQPDSMAGGVSGSLQIDFPTSVTQVFSDPPKAAQVLEGDFVGGVITGETKAKAKTDFNVFAWPSADEANKGVVVGGGDVMVMFKDNPAARAFMEYLATPESGVPWAKRGGFASPNKNFDPNNYADPLFRQTATDFANASEFVFDMSDLQPGAFGSDSEFTILQDFLKNPDNPEATAKKLEAAAAKAYKAS